MIQGQIAQSRATLLRSACTALLVSTALPGWAGIYKCEVNGQKAEYRATPCPAGKSVALKVAAAPVAASAARPSSAPSQAEAVPKAVSPLDNRLSLNLPNTPVRVALQVVADFVGYTLAADPSIQEEGSFNYQSQPASAVLADLARRHGLVVSTAGRTITVKRK